jgi:hypothetical protein
LQGEFVAGDTIRIDVGADGELTFEKLPATMPRIERSEAAR